MSEGTKEVEQIRYTRWGSEPPEHGWYWNAVDGIAWLIGRALEAEGLRVVQTKEKFGRACVYVGCNDDEDAPLSTVERRKSYHFVYMMALAAHPQLRSAILAGADFPKLASGEHDPENTSTFPG
jgi:hypothetical protein